MPIKVDSLHRDLGEKQPVTTVEVTLVTERYDYFEEAGFEDVQLSITGNSFAIRSALRFLEKSDNCTRTHLYDENGNYFSSRDLRDTAPALEQDDSRHLALQQGNVAIKIKVHQYRPTNDSYEVDLTGEKSAACRTIKAHLHDTPRCNFSYVEARTNTPLLRTEILGGSVPFLSNEEYQSAQSNAATSMRVRILYYEFGAIDRAEELAVSGTSENVARFIFDNLKDMPTEIEHQFALSSEDRWLTTNQLREKLDIKG